MLLTRQPRSALRPFVGVLWVSYQGVGARRDGAGRERVLPSGAMHLVFRLSDEPLRLLDAGTDRAPRSVGLAVVGGARATPYVRDLSGPVLTVGAQLEPGASELLLGPPADELADRHTPLEQLWGPAAAIAREQLLEAADPERQLDLFEAMLLARLPDLRGLHPAVAHALGRFRNAAPVRVVVEESGFSHRRFIELFRRAVGLSPKLYSRLLRFQSALDGVGRESASLAALALAAGYSDQAHFNREFQEFSGLSPTRYREAQPASAHHVPLARQEQPQDEVLGRATPRVSSPQAYPRG